MHPILRSGLGPIAGIIAAIVMIAVIESLSSLIYPHKAFDPTDREAMNELFRKMTTGQFLMVLLAWQSGAFAGGALSAWVAGRWQLLHAGIIGGFVALATWANIRIYEHPDWVVWAGLLLPIPVSLLAGTLMMRRRTSDQPKPAVTARKK